MNTNAGKAPQGFAGLSIEGVKETLIEDIDPLVIFKTRLARRPRTFRFVSFQEERRRDRKSDRRFLKLFIIVIESD